MASVEPKGVVMEDEWTSVISGDRLVKFTYLDLPTGEAFLTAQSDRITAESLPSYSPDYNPIEYLGKKTKQRATHNKYFKEFAELTVSVEKALAYFAMHSETVL